jgi:hypothetical protein
MGHLSSGKAGLARGDRKWRMIRTPYLRESSGAGTASRADNIRIEFGSCQENCSAFDEFLDEGRRVVQRIPDIPVCLEKGIVPHHLRQYAP